jgi:hypothetical protein
MTCRCPRCESDHIKTKGYARRAVCAIGTLAGAAGGAAGATSGAEIGAMSGFMAGPVGAVLGGVAGAIVGALVGGTAGGAAGAALGQVIDANILDSLVCLDCEFSFSTADGEDIERPFYE